MAISLAVGAGALALALSTRGLYEADSARSRLTQSLQASKDFLVSDVRQAGERLPPDFPAIEIVQGASGAPDELVMRRNLLDTVLLVCDDVAPTNLRVTVALLNGAPPGCAALPVNPGDTFPSNIEAWHDYRTANGGRVKAYIFDPANQVGEFFEYSGERLLVDRFIIRRAQDSPFFSRSYEQANLCRVYLLEERRYRLSGDVLQMVVDNDGTAPVNLVDGISDFQAEEVWKAGFGPGDPWTKASAIELTVNGRVPIRRGAIERSWSAEVMPRNVLAQ